MPGCMYAWLYVCPYVPMYVYVCLVCRHYYLQQIFSSSVRWWMHAVISFSHNYIRVTVLALPRLLIYITVESCWHAPLSTRNNTSSMPSPLLYTYNSSCPLLFLHAYDIMRAIPGKAGIYICIYMYIHHNMYVHVDIYIG